MKNGSRPGNPRTTESDRLARARASLQAAERDAIRGLMVGNPRDMVRRAWGIGLEGDIPAQADRAGASQARHGDDSQPR